MLRIKYSYSKQSNTELKWTQWPHLPTNPIQLLVSCADIWHKNQMWCTAWEKQDHHLNCLLQQASFKITLFCLFFSKWLSNWIICYLYVWLLVYYCKAITITLSPNFFLGIKSTFYKLNLFPRAYSRLLLLVRMDLTGETWKEYTLDFFFLKKVWLAFCTLGVQLTTAPNIEKNASSDGLIKQGGDIFLLIAMCCTEYHHSVLWQKDTTHRKSQFKTSRNACFQLGWKQ